MRTAACILLLVLSASCTRELRSRNPQAWLELSSEHFTLRTDLEEPDARAAIADLELLRNALLAAGWSKKTMSTAPIAIVALADEKELHEFVKDRVGGITNVDHFGERLMIFGDGARPLRSTVMKHELTHALVRGFLATNPRWVQEGIACYLETLDVDRSHGTAVRGGTDSDRMNMLRYYPLRRLNWSMAVIGAGTSIDADNGYEYETLAWALVHWMADEHPQQFRAFLGGLARGESMWTAFAASFPNLTESMINRAMIEYVAARSMHEDTVNVAPWHGSIAVRRIAPADVHALRAQIFASTYHYWGKNNVDSLQDELAQAKALDPGNPLALALSQRPDPKLAIDHHPEDWRSWVLWFDEHEKDTAAIRKAAELAPDNPDVLLRLAQAEQRDGNSQQALRVAERASTMLPGAGALHGLAAVYDANGRCDEATVSEQRAIDALRADVDEKWPAEFRARLADIQAHCGKGDAIGSAAHTVVAEPVLKICRQPVKARSYPGVLAHFTIRENGTVTAVALNGAPEALNAELRDFVQSCSFEPVVVNGKPRQVQLDLKLDDMLQ